MANLHHNSIDPTILDALYAGRFGIEIEEHRVQTSTHTLSRHPHPSALGDRQTQPYFQTDFSESQEEVVTSPQHSTKQALAHLHELQTILAEALTKDEIIWPLSMPPHLNADDIHFLNTHFERPWYQDYRDLLLARYGSFQHIMAGIHVNFSPDEKLIDWYSQQHHIHSRATAKNTLFFQIAQQVASYRWLLTYLFGASPVSENPADNLPKDRTDIEPVRSWRTSEFGFANLPEIQIDYVDLETQVQQIQQYIAKGDLYDKSEFYGPVRLKAPGDLPHLVQNGAEYIEFRLFDIDPFTQDGISQNALSFLHLLILDAIINPENWQKHELDSARALNHVVSLQNPNDLLPETAMTYANTLFSRLAYIVQSAPTAQRPDFQAALDFARTAVQQPNLTVGAKLVPFIDNQSLISFGLQRGLDILNTRQQSTLTEDFPNVPDHLIKTYIQAHQLGLETTLDTENRQLQVRRDGQIITLTSDQDLK